jgi:tagaturonate reductase
MTRPRLNASVVDEMRKLVPQPRAQEMAHLPERVLQFGEGVFLRGFVDWMIDLMNRQSLFNGRVVVVQPLPRGTVDQLNEQDGFYTLLLGGIRDAKIVKSRQVISSISRGIDPYRDYPGFLRCAENPDLRFIVSNTTEAGIVFSPTDRLADSPPASFPGKLTALLHARFREFNGGMHKGLVLLPCELIERNGDTLKKCVVQTAESWGLGAEFLDWVENANCFTNTVVDRIVTGYPADEAAAIFQELGYEDALLDAGELYHSWVIEGPEQLADELPFHRAGLEVIWTRDVTPYRDRKVRILNGAHTMAAPVGFLAGKQTVQELVDDPAISEFLRRGIGEEIIPTLDLPRAELETFAAAVSDRFANPCIRHQLTSITPNSTSKFKVRALPSILEYLARKSSLPRRLTFSLAGLIAFYRGTEIRDGALIGSREGGEYKILDDPAVLEVFSRAWSAFDSTLAGAESLVTNVLSRQVIWQRDLNVLPGLARAVAADLCQISTRGPLQAMKETGRQ